MFFGITSFLLILSLNLVLTFERFLRNQPEQKRNFTIENLRAYVRWIVSWKKSFLKLECWDKSLDYVIAWGRKNFKGWTVWVFYALGLSYIYLALSGFLFAWFIPRGLFGFPLLLHVAAGALFAVSLTFILFLKGRDYFLEENLASSQGESQRLFYCPGVGKSFPKIYLQIAAFWCFILAGFFLIASTLGSMLPFFNYPAQIFFFNVHRWSALVSVLAACLAVDVIIVE
ncbi:MAG: hypothetical protein ACPLRA_06955 [Candidatus Saccharicenans sp.]